MLTRKQFNLPETPKNDGEIAGYVERLKRAVLDIWRDLNLPGSLFITQSNIENCVIENSTIGATTASTGVFTKVTVDDANFNLDQVTGTDPRLTLDSGDYFEFTRAGNLWSWYIGSLPYWSMGSSLDGANGFSIQNIPIGSVSPATGKFTSMEWTGAAIIGDAGADTINFKSAAWTFTNAVTVTGTWANLGTVTTADLNGGTIDGTVIGGASAAAGTFTTLTSTGNTVLGDASTDTLNVGNGGIIKDTSGNVGIGNSGSITAVRQVSVNVTGAGTNDGADISIRKKGGGYATLRMATVGDATGWDVNYNFPGTDDWSLYWLGSGAGTKLAVTSDGRLYGTALHNNAGAVTGTTNQYIASGTYTPTLTNTNNVAASTTRSTQWTRVGNVVTVGGEMDVDVTAGAGTLTSFWITLPIASAIANSYNLGGSGAWFYGAADSVAIYGDVGNDGAIFTFAANNANSNKLTFSFTYVVL